MGTFLERALVCARLCSCSDRPGTTRASLSGGRSVLRPCRGCPVLRSTHTVTWEDCSCSVALFAKNLQGQCRAHPSKCRVNLPCGSTALPLAHARSTFLCWF